MFNRFFFFILLFYLLLTFYCTIKMVMCAVAACSTTSGKDNVAMFSFPKAPELRKGWIFKCRRKNYKPSKHAKICEYHFDDSDFVISRSFAASVGFNEKFNLQLKPDAKSPSILMVIKRREGNTSNMTSSLHRSKSLF